MVVSILGNQNSGKTTFSMKIVTEKNTEENFETLGKSKKLKLKFIKIILGN